MSIEEFVSKYSLEPVDEVKRIMPSGFWGDQSLNEVVNVEDKNWLVNNFCQLSLAPFKSLQSLDLTNCESAKPAADFFNSASLEELTKMGGKLKLAKGFAGLTNLRRIKLSAVHITSLPKSIGTLEFLESLVLADTKVKKMPDTLHELKRLKTLEVWPQLQALPDQLPASLEKVDLRSNKLEALPSILLSLPSLAWLDVSSNPIHELTIPESINQCLKVLKVSRAPFALSKGVVDELQGAFPNAEVSGGDGGKFIEDGKTIYLSSTKLYYSTLHPKGTASYH